MSLVLAACGGKTSTSHGGSVSDASPGAVCPASSIGPCGLEGEECEYGGDPQAACDMVFTCRGGLLQPETQHTDGCPTPDAGMSDECPAYPPPPATVDGGGACRVGLICDYPAGRCQCANDFLELQAGFACAVPAAGCAAVRPRLGTACTLDGQSCSYETCGVSTDFGIVRCEGGIWVRDVDEPFCPG